MGKFKVGDRVLDIGNGNGGQTGTVFAVSGKTIKMDWDDDGGSPEWNDFWPEEDFALIESTIEKVESLIKVGSLVRIKHTDYGDKIKVGSLRRVSKVDDDGVMITVFSEEFNSDILLYFYFNEVE